MNLLLSVPVKTGRESTIKLSRKAHLPYLLLSKELTEEIDNVEKELLRNGF